VLFAKVGRDLRKGDAGSVRRLFPDNLGPADEEALARDAVRQTIEAMLLESLRQGTRGVAHDYRLEARPWKIPLDEIEVPFEIWHERGRSHRLAGAEPASRSSAPTCEHTFPPSRRARLALVQQRRGDPSVSRRAVEPTRQAVAARRSTRTGSAPRQTESSPAMASGCASTTTTNAAPSENTRRATGSRGVRQPDS
jgi:hypothetical protein